MKKAIFIIFALMSLTFADGDAPLWLRYPSISPDGEQIAFSYFGDLYVVKTSGGTAIQITSHPAHDFMPVWSPDGKQIAFASHRHGNYDIFVIPATGGTPQRLTFHSSDDFPGSWNPDGKAIVFTSSRMDDVESILFPSGVLSELYEVSLNGSLPRQILTVPAESAWYGPQGKFIYYHDRKGYENAWRKHHRSSVTRDVWRVDVRRQKFTRLTDFNGEDRNPVTADGKWIYYLSETSGSFNVWKMKSNGKSQEQLTFYNDHPVRFLSISKDGTLCYGYRGGIYLLPEGWTEPYKVDIVVHSDEKANEIQYETFSDGATEMAVSPDGKEVAFVVRGEVFVTATDYGITRRITHTPEQERNISFSHDGRTLLYAGERKGSWNLYKSVIVREDDIHFFSAVEIREEPVLVTEAETFQPLFSPGDSLIAYLHERTEIRILDPSTGNIHTVLPGDRNYSYSDGDQHFQWSPDGKWIVTNFLPSSQRWSEDIALVSIDGNTVVNITESGYFNWSPFWSASGDMIYCFSNELGMRSHGSWGSQSDVFGFYTSDSTYEESKFSKAEWEELKARREKQKKAEKSENKKDDEDEDKKEAKPMKPIRIETEGFRDRKRRLTVHSSNLSDARVTPDGKYLVYLARFEKGFDLWKVDLRERTPSLVVKLGSGRAESIQFDTTGTHVYLLHDNGKIARISIENGEKKEVGYSAEMDLNLPGERAYIFEHIWRQVKKKFYVEDLHGVDWDALKVEYAAFLPSINNNHDFAELVSELLGELNASHTGCYYRPRKDDLDKTFSLGMFLNPANGGGLEIQEVVKGGPADKYDLQLSPGMIIRSIDKKEITAGLNYYPLLNRKNDQKVLLEVYDPTSGETREVVVKPVSWGRLNNLLYKRWVESRRVLVDSLSHGQLGYVHVRGMSDGSFRKTFSEIFGRQVDKKALIVDTRFNGGGWLHDDLARLLSGTDYAWMIPRGQPVGKEPQNRWTKPVVVVMGESNYSDAHFFPYTFKALDIGKTVGMPVPGTATAVWWERLQDPSLVFGIPQVGIKDKDGRFLENNELEPDYQVLNDPESVAKGRDKQIEKAVEVLLKQISGQ